MIKKPTENFTFRSVLFMSACIIFFPFCVPFPLCFLPERYRFSRNGKSGKLPGYFIGSVRNQSGRYKFPELYQD